MLSSFIRKVVGRSSSREEVWTALINKGGFTDVAEVGVFRGEFAEVILKGCPSIQRYYLIDPWRHLSQWNKPANMDSRVFKKYYQETLKRTDFAKDKRVVLRGTTSEVVDSIPDGSLDFAYIDGDHTLRGITIDLQRIYPKVKDGGWIGGDDLTPDIWHHSPDFEPTMVFPYALYFAEASDNVIYLMPQKQFLIHKDVKRGFKRVNLSKNEYNPALRKQLLISPVITRLKHRVTPVYERVVRKLKPGN